MKTLYSCTLSPLNNAKTVLFIHMSLCASSIEELLEVASFPCKVKLYQMHFFVIVVQFSCLHLGHKYALMLLFAPLRHPHGERLKGVLLSPRGSTNGFRI